MPLLRAFRPSPLRLALAVALLPPLVGCGGESRKSGTVAPSLSPEEQDRVMKESAEYYKSNQGQFPR